MFKDGFVERAGSGKRGNPYLWSKIIPHGNVPYGAETNSDVWEDVTSGAS
jgi:hypothetical protein